MKIIEKYVFSSFLSSFFLAFVVLTFVMTIGLMVQIARYILDGIPGALVAKFAYFSFPETLQWTVPLSLLVSSVLVFSRLSADSEIAAMRSCGINIVSVIKWPLVFSVFCTLLACYINNEISPRGHENRSELKYQLSTPTAIDLMEPGRVIRDFPDIRIYCDRKEGSWLYDLTVMDYSNPEFDRTVEASKALVTNVAEDIVLELYGMTVSPIDKDNPGIARIHRYHYVMEDVLKKQHKKSRKVKDLRLGELFEKMEDVEEKARASMKDTPTKTREKHLMKRNLSQIKVEISKRFVFAMASFCFVLVGIPLGIKSHRKESSIGMAISLAVSLGYYAISILMISLHKTYAVHPEILIWLPVPVCICVSGFLLKKHL